MEKSPNSAASNAQLAAGDEIDLSQLALTLWRGKHVIAICALIAILLGGYHAYVRAVPMYTTSATVALQNRQQQTIDIESVVSGLSGDQVSINTEVEVFRSRGLFEKLVRDLNLVEDPEFNATLRPSSKFSIGGLKRLLLGGTTNAPSEQVILDNVVNSALKAVSISNIRQSQVFRVTAVTQSPQKSAAIANRVAELYILDQIEVKFDATQQATEWLTERVTQLQIDLETAENELKNFNTNTDLISPETLIALNRQLKELRDRRVDTQTLLESSKAKIAALEAARATNDLQAMAEATTDKSIASAYERAQNGSPIAEQAFLTLFDNLITRSKLEAERTESRLTALTDTVVDFETQIELQSEELVRLQQYQREAEASRLIYEYFLGRLKETSVQQGIQQADSRILSHAVVPQSPSAPRKSMILALSAILGAFAGAAFILAREFSQTTFRSAEDIEQRTGYAVLGQVPAIPSKVRKNVLKYLKDKPASAAAEAIRNLRTSILLSDIDNPPQVIMMTSSVPGEGKTTGSLALAQNLSGLGKKVILVEGDIRRRTFREYFNIKGKKGLLSVLSHEQKLEDVVVRDDSLNADILIGELSPTNAADLFSSARFGEFLKELRELYDYIIIDTPPVLAVPDARVIGQSVDAVIYTVKWDATTHRQVLEGLKAFEHVNVKVSGIVLAQIDAKGMKRYGYGDSYAAYASYYDS